MDIYLLSGLGADERLFQYLDLKGHRLIPLNWITPCKDESIEDYAQRIAPQVRDGNSVLIGVSFGGIMAMEIGKHIQIHKIILISSVESFKELPVTYRLAGRLRLHRILTPALLKRTQVS